jgi:hypothetical protein
MIYIQINSIHDSHKKLMIAENFIEAYDTMPLNQLVFIFKFKI